MDIKRIEEYNKKLGEFTRQQEAIRSELKVHEAQLDEACKKLTQMLGRPVTRENLQAVYDEYMAQVENTVNSGFEIMSRIEGATVTQAPTGATPGQGTAGQANGGCAGFGQAPTQQTVQPPVSAPQSFGGMPFGMATPAQQNVPAQPVQQVPPVQPVVPPVQRPAQAPTGVQMPSMLWNGDVQPQ